MKDAAARWFPFLAWRGQVTRETLRSDALAGLTGALAVLPQAVAFATIAGLPPQYGFYAAMLPAIVAALWGSSRHLVSGPTTAISLLVLATLSPLAAPGSERYLALVLTLCLLTGLIQLAMGLARLGALVNFISHTVIIGFTAGAALLIVASQLKHFLGLAVPAGSSFHQTLVFAAEHLGEAHAWVVLVGMVTLLAGLLARRWLPRVPYMIVAMLAGSLTAALLDHLLGAEKTGIQTVGALPAVWPVLSFPDLSYGTVSVLIFPALMVAMIGLTEAVAIARAMAVKSGQRLDTDQEFIGQGLSNVVGSLSSAYPCSGSFNRSGINLEAGARTPLAAVFSAPFLLLIALLAAPLAAHLPVAAMAAILFIVAWGLIDWHHIGQILQRHPGERVVLLVTLLGVLVDLEKGLLAGVLVSLLFYLYRTSRPAMEEHLPAPPVGSPRALRRQGPLGHHGHLGPGEATCPQLALLRLNGSIYFGAVEHVRERMRRVDAREPRRKWLVLLTQGVNFVDLAGAQLLGEEARRRQALGGGLLLVGVRPAVRGMLERSGEIQTVGAQHLLARPADALVQAYPLLDVATCRSCQARVFGECQQRLPDGSLRDDPESPPPDPPAARRAFP